MLGVWIQPSLQWNKEFNIVQEKLVFSTKKLMNTDLKVSLMYLYFHCYMIKNVFFRCRVVHFSPPEEKELNKLYKQPIIDKLRLGMKFPRRALYIYKKVLGVGLMEPNTIIAALALKLYFGHTRLQSETNLLIESNLEKLQVEIGRNNAIEEIPLDEKHWNRTWLDHVFELYQKRNIKVERDTNFLSNITRNKTIMDYAVGYNKTSVTIGRINHIRLFKKMFLPCEALGFNGHTPTSCYFNREEKKPV